jgi:hypothetical protein
MLTTHTAVVHVQYEARSFDIPECNTFVMCNEYETTFARGIVVVPLTWLFDCSSRSLCQIMKSEVPVWAWSRRHIIAFVSLLS